MWSKLTRVNPLLWKTKSKWVIINRSKTTAVYLLTLAENKQILKQPVQNNLQRKEAVGAARIDFKKLVYFWR